MTAPEGGKVFTEKLTRFEGEILKEFFRMNRDVNKIIRLRRINKRWKKAVGKPQEGK